MFYDAATWVVRHQPGDGGITVFGAHNWEQRARAVNTPS
jgi:hypothetical protein